MKNKIIILLIGLLLVGTVVGVGFGITPRDSTLDSKLSETVKTELGSYVRNVEYDDNIYYKEGNMSKNVWATLIYEEEIKAWDWIKEAPVETTAWVKRSKPILLWLDYYDESKYCNKYDKDNPDFCSEWVNTPIDDFIEDKMIIGADRFLGNKHSNLYPVIPDKVDAGKKTIDLT